MQALKTTVALQKNALSMDKFQQKFQKLQVAKMQTVQEKTTMEARTKQKEAKNAMLVFLSAFQKQVGDVKLWKFWHQF